MTNTEITNVITIQKVDVKNMVTTEDKRDVTIKPMIPLQFMAVSKILKKAIDELNSDENITGALSGLFDNVDAEMEVTEALQTAGSQFIKDASGSLGKLIVMAPELTAELVAVLANMDKRELLLQDMDVFFNIVDTTIQVNDFNAVIERLKKSGKSLQNSMNFSQFLNNILQ